MDLEFAIVSYGGGEVLQTMFNAISKLANGKDGTIFQPLMRLGLTVGLLWAVVSAIGGDQYKQLILNWLVPFYMSYALLFAPTCTLHIIDPTAPGQDYPVANVPWALGAFAGTVSGLSDAITKEIERFFSLPDDLLYHKTGALMASRLIADAKTYHITNAEVAESMKDFVNQCVIYDALIGYKYTLEDLRTTPDIWKFVTETHTPSPARAFTFKQPGKDAASIVTCSEGAQELKKLLKTEVETGFAYFGKLFFGSRTTQNSTTPMGKAAATLLKSYMPVAFKHMTGMAENAEQVMRQQMMIYTTMDAIEEKSTALGNAQNFAVRRAYLQQRAQQETMGAVMNQKLIAAKNVMEAIIYASFMFIIPLAMLPLGWRYIGRWGSLVLWINMWAPLYAIVNFIANANVRSQSLAAASLQTDTGITIANSVGIMNLHADMAAQAAFMTVSVGALAYMIIRGGAGSFVHLAEHMSGPASSAASRATEDMVSGNYSFGNVSSGNIQAHNASSFQENWSPSLHSGAFSSNDGVVSRMTSAEGTSILNIGNSQLRSQLNLSDTMSNSYTAQAGEASSASQNAMVAASQSESDAYRKTLDLAHHQATQQQSDRGHSSNTSYSSDASLQKLENLTQRFAQDHNMSYSDASAMFGVIAANIGIDSSKSGFGVGNAISKMTGLSLGVSGQAGKDWKSSESDNRTFSEAQDYMKQHGMAETLRQAVAVAQNLRFGSSDSEGRRYADSIGASLDKANSYRTEAAAQLQQSNSYSEMATWARQNAGTINQNLSQEYVEWLEDQSLPNSSGPMGRHEAETILTSRSDLDRVYSQRFLENKMQGMTQYLSLQTGHAQVHDTYLNLHKDVKSSVNNDSATAVNVQATQLGLGADFNLDHTAEKDYTKVSHEVQGEINDNNMNLRDNTIALQEGVKEKVS